MVDDREDGAAPLRAAQYVRMSTDHQRYSLVNQKAAIAEYADTRGYEIVSTYADAGKSGLSLKGRQALQKLLSDALNPNRSFDAILVLDVSRWGRFQDPDQAAHYEFICREAGLKVVYCAEPFENDNSPATTILKHIKRVMAAEYSRELSVKLSRAHLQQASLGFRQGGGLAYGFRRLLVDEHGQPRFVLEAGQQKALNTDRVIVILGPVEEQEVIRRIFQWYVRQKLSIAAIARRLRSEGILGAHGRPWTAMRVRTVLGSELCVGRYTYNRTTGRLQGAKRKNPEYLWVRAATMKPLIPEKLFREAQERLAVRRGGRYSDRKILKSLCRLLKEEGRLSNSLIARSKFVPSATTLRNHFGSLTKAFELIGYVQSPWFHLGPTGHTWTDEALLQGLQRLHASEGFLSNKAINEDPELPSGCFIRRRFGSLYRAYELSGLPPMTHSEIVLASIQRRRHTARITPPGGCLRASSGFFLPRFSSEALLQGLSRLLEQHGYLSARLIDEDLDMPSSAAVARRFGSLLHAYDLVGWPKSLQQIMVETYQRRAQTLRSQVP